MALMCKGGFNLYEHEKPSVVVFEETKRRLNTKKQMIEDLQNEYNLLEYQAFDQYQRHVSYMLISEPMIDSASKWLNMLKNGTDADGNKLDKRKKYDEKFHFEYIRDYFQRILGIDDMEIESIYDWNFKEGARIYFASHDREWVLEIPYVKGVKFKSFQMMGESCFKLALCVKTGEHSSRVIGSTFEEDELKDIMQKGIEGYCNDV